MQEANYTHLFDNGIQVYKEYLLPQQLVRYREHNLHEPEEEAVFLDLWTSIAQPEAVLFDVGAAIGYYALLALQHKKQARIWAFEPLADHREAVRRHLALNHVAADRVQLTDIALSTTDGTSAFLAHDYSSKLAQVEKETPWWQRLLGRSAGLGSQAGQQMVPTRSLDSFLTEHDLTVDLLKMDIQGAEYLVLQGAVATARAGKIRRWLIGTHGIERHRQCLHWLQEQGYTISVDHFATEHQPDGILAATL